MRFMTMLICNHGEVGLGFSSEDHEFKLKAPQSQYIIH